MTQLDRILAMVTYDHPTEPPSDKCWGGTSGGAMGYGCSNQPANTSGLCHHHTAEIIGPTP